jgi:hypothetical protein
VHPNQCSTLIVSPRSEARSRDKTLFLKWQTWPKPGRLDTETFFLFPTQTS